MSKEFKFDNFIPIDGVKLIEETLKIELFAAQLSQDLSEEYSNIIPKLVYTEDFEERCKRMESWLYETLQCHGLENRTHYDPREGTMTAWVSIADKSFAVVHFAQSHTLDPESSNWVLYAKQKNNEYATVGFRAPKDQPFNTISSTNFITVVRTLKNYQKQLIK
jgi:hypothetical protein